MILPRLAPGAAVAIIRLRSMGDTVLTTPALALLKQARPDLRIFVVVEQPWKRLLERNPDIDGLITVAAGGRGRAISEVRHLRPELCLNLHGGSTSSWITALSRARWRAGFAHFQASAIYNVKIPRAQEILGRAPDEPVHTAEHLASAVFYLGAPQGEIPRARLYVDPPQRAGPYAVLHIAAAYFTKEWPAERFAEIARWLRQECGLEPVLLTGPGQGHLLGGMKEFDTYENPPLGEMMSLVSGARLFLGNDSGPAHVAAAFGVPCVVIFGSSNSRVWRPWRTRHEVVETAWDCKPCPGDRCYAFDRPHCILSVEVAAVERAVRSLLPLPTFGVFSATSGPTGCGSQCR